jgi:hypothetical protein
VLEVCSLQTAGLKPGCAVNLTVVAIRSITGHGVVSRTLHRGYGCDIALIRSISPFDRVCCLLKVSCCESTAGVDGAPPSTSQPSNGGTKCLQSEHVGLNLHEHNHDMMLKDSKLSLWSHNARCFVVYRRANHDDYSIHAKRLPGSHLYCSNQTIAVKSSIYIS